MYPWILFFGYHSCFTFGVDLYLNALNEERVVERKSENEKRHVVALCILNFKCFCCTMFLVRSITTWTKFWPFLTTTYLWWTNVDISDSYYYLLSMWAIQKLQSLSHIPQYRPCFFQCKQSHKPPLSKITFAFLPQLYSSTSTLNSSTSNQQPNGID